MTLLFPLKHTITRVAHFLRVSFNMDSASASPINFRNADISAPFSSDDPGLVRSVEDALARLEQGVVPESPEVPFNMSVRQRSLLERCNCPAEFIVNCDSESRFETLMATYVNGPSPHQRDYLAKHGINPDDVKTKEQASEIIGRLQEKAPMTQRQLRVIERLKGRHNKNFTIPDGLKQASASRFIMEMQRSAPTTYKQHQALERHGIPIHKIPVTARESTMLLSAIANPNKVRTDWINLALERAGGTKIPNVADAYVAARTEGAE